jgi:hypothetical protein
MSLKEFLISSCFPAFLIQVSNIFGCDSGRLILQAGPAGRQSERHRETVLTASSVVIGVEISRAFSSSNVAG